MQVDALRFFIREKLQDGRLPHERTSQVQSRPADGQKCDGCEKLITMARFVVTGTTLAGLGSIQLHVECFQHWDDERCARRSSPRHRVRSRDVGPTVALSYLPRVENRVSNIDQFWHVGRVSNIDQSSRVGADRVSLQEDV
jgi:hypothetical protein